MMMAIRSSHYRTNLLSFAVFFWMAVKERSFTYGFQLNKEVATSWGSTSSKNNVQQHRQFVSSITKDSLLTDHSLVRRKMVVNDAIVEEFSEAAIIKINGEDESCLPSSQKQRIEEMEEAYALNPIDSKNKTLPMAPPLTFDKYITMQTKRVPVVVRYSSGSGLKPYYLTVAKKIKDTYPDVTIDKCILPQVDNDDEITFEVVIDGKTVVGRDRNERFGGRDDMSVFVSMEELDVAITRARRKRRPATVYGEDLSNIRLEMLQRQKNKAINNPQQ